MDDLSKFFDTFFDAFIYIYCCKNTRCAEALPGCRGYVWGYCRQKTLVFKRYLIPHAVNGS